MKKLFVYGDFNWLTLPIFIGELSFDSIRGNDTYSFSFDKNWLVKYGEVFFGEDLRNYPGPQYTTPGQDIFGCFSDALPDRWGRTLLNRREQILAKEEKRQVKRLSSFDYLMGIDDASRMGALRFAEVKDGDFINISQSYKVPPLTNIYELMNASIEIEKSEEKNLLPSKKWIVQLIHPGTSLGGARPKASILDEKGMLTMAKFPSRKDDYDVASWEHFSHVMARKAGIMVADTRLIAGTDKYHILLSKRFDRTQEGKRIHFASALTLLGLTDGNNASTNHGYLDIVDFMLQHGASPEKDLKELYRRVAFNIIIGNCDDHFRNHGFLLTRNGWVLSPAYDMNPTLQNNQSLLINNQTSESDLDILLKSASDYLLTPEESSLIINQVKCQMRSWRKEAISLNLTKREIDMFAPRLNKWL